MARSIQRIAMVSMHTSPTAQPGTADAGGLNVSVLALAEQLAESGIDVSLVTHAAERAVTPVLPGVTLFELPAGARGAQSKEQLAGLTDKFGERITELARLQRFDVLHSHYWLSGVAALPTAIERGLPLVHSFHTLAATKESALGAATEPAVRKHAETLLAGRADALVAASAAEAASIIALGAPSSHTWIVPLGVDLAQFAPRSSEQATATRRMLGLDLDRPIVVVAARIQPLKGHELAVRAIADVRARQGWAPLLVIAGEATPGEEAFETELRRLARELGVSADVAFVGSLDRDALAGLFAAASVTLVASFSETFGLVALESAACATPVIAFRTGGLTDAVSDGVSGIVLDSRDPHVWGKQLVDLLEHNELRLRLSAGARVHAERFTWSTAATRLLKVYEEVTG